MVTWASTFLLALVLYQGDPSLILLAPIVLFPRSRLKP